MDDNIEYGPNDTKRPILVAVDGSATSYQAVAWAAVEAALHHWRLHILTSSAVQTGFGPGTPLAEQEMESLRADGERILAEAIEVVQKAVSGEAVEVTTELTFELITTALIDRSAQARMVVVGNRGRGAISRTLLGSVSSAVAGHAHCPVAVVHGISAIDPVSAGKPVLVGVEGTPNSVPAIRVAFEEASRRKVGLAALLTWSDTSGLQLPTAGWEDIRTSQEASLAECLAGWGEQYPDVPVQRIVRHDSPVRSLLEESENMQLLVVGSHGRGGFARMVLGSTSAALLHSVECPMIVVRR